MERNDAAFNDIRWHPAKLQQHVWLGLIVYGRLEWDTIIKKRQTTEAMNTQKERFEKVWCLKGVCTVMNEGIPRWVFAGPRDGFVFEPH